MRKIFAFSFLAILLLNTFGYFVSFSVKRYHIRRQVERLLKQEAKKHTQQFTFTPNQFKRLRRCENGKEFSMGGYMYDVVKTEFKNGSFILTAYCDHKETNLLGKFSALFGKQTAHTNSKIPLPVFSLMEFIPAGTYWQCQVPELCIGIFALYKAPVLKLALDVASPPPDNSAC